MAIAHNMHMAQVRVLVTSGWQEWELYPHAGITILRRREQFITVMKNGRVKAGSHPPQ